MRRPSRRIVEPALLFVSAVCVSVAVDYGAGFSLGWWGLLFWFGVGGLLAWVKA